MSCFGRAIGGDVYEQRLLLLADDGWLQPPFLFATTMKLVQSQDATKGLESLDGAVKTIAAAFQEEVNAI